jgi:hypothetical protein
MADKGWIIFDLPYYENSTNLNNQFGGEECPDIIKRWQTYVCKL